MFCIFIVAIVTPLLGGCFGKGTSADPPANFMATAGDGRVMLTWDPVPNVDFWIFTATDPSLTAFNWAGLSNAHAYINAATPFYLCGLFDGTQYYFAANGRANGGPGGTSSPTISDTPIMVPRAAAWSTPTTIPSADIYGIGYTGLTKCSNIATSAAGSFAAVGANGAIFTSDKTDGLANGISWTSHPVTGGFAYNLYAVAGYAANQNNPTNPKLRWVAVGDGGASFISTDANAATWTAGTAYDAGNPALRALTHVGATFWAAGDIDVATSEATILSSTDGITWTKHTSHAPSILRGITHGISTYVAVGDGGTITTSTDGSTWTIRDSTTTENLRQASSFLDTYVAVGDNGIIVTSIDKGVTWTKQSLGTGISLVGVAANAQLATLNSSGAAYTSATTGVAANLQFVAVDSAGYYYTSPDGLTWLGPVSTGVTSLNALVSSGFGYVAVGNSGATAYAF
jgi:hypothetical protein